jgi:pilus assembly protein CpaE
VSLEQYRFLVLLDDHVTDAAVRAALPPAASVHVTSLRDAVSRVGKLLDETAPDLVLVGCATHSEAALQIVVDVTERRPESAVVVLYEGNPNGFMGPAFKAGAQDLIVLPQSTAQLTFQLEKVIARHRGPGATGSTAPLIAILGPKGGTGKTLTACNLAIALAADGARPVIVDIDLQFGDVGLALGLRPDKTIFDLVTTGGSLDAEKVDSFLMEHPTGARALLAPTRPEQAAAITMPFLRQVYDVLRLSHDFVIVDTPPAFSPEVIATIDQSSHLCMVGMLDALSLKDTKIGFETLAAMGYEADDIMLVLNRADSSVGISVDDVYRLLGKLPDVLVPSDRAIPRALTSGKTIFEVDSRSGPARSFAELAYHYLRIAAMPTSENAYDGGGSEPTRRRSLLRRRS